MANRRAPVTGYDFGAKRQYRRALYAAVRRIFNNQMADRTCAILPSIEGDEIEAAMHAGFHQSRIAIIDRNPAIVATLKRRYPLVAAIGVDAARAAQRIVETIGPVDFVNLDLCGPIGREVHAAIDGWTDARAVKVRGLVAITVLRGRETGEPFRDPTAVTCITAGKCPPVINNTGTDALRLSDLYARLSGFHLQTRTAWARCGYGAGLMATGAYRSTAGSQSMLWTLFGLHDRACLCDWCLLAFMGAAAQWARQVLHGEQVPYREAFNRKVRALCDGGLNVDAIIAANGINKSATPVTSVTSTSDDWKRKYAIRRNHWPGARPRREKRVEGIATDDAR